MELHLNILHLTITRVVYN